MPLYEYECFVCKRRFQRIQSVSDSPATECPSCAGRVRRLLGVPALQFKGSGWYVTDYGKGNSAGRSTEKEDKKPAAETKKKEPATASSTGTTTD